MWHRRISQDISEISLISCDSEIATRVDYGLIITYYCGDAQSSVYLCFRPGGGCLKGEHGRYLCAGSLRAWSYVPCVLARRLCRDGQSGPLPREEEPAPRLSAVRPHGRLARRRL